jgi:cyclopropane fatty-acyl-phospholipid synthase-like methyltransferase
MDAVFSYDVFVHIAPAETRQYIAEFARVLRPGGIGVVHHPGDPTESGAGWRSSVTSEMFAQMLADAGLTFERRLNRWGPDGAFSIGDFDDYVTVFTKPL